MVFQGAWQFTTIRLFQAPTQVFGQVNHSTKKPSLSIYLDGIPSDGIPIEEVLTVSLALTVVYVTLATAGIVFAVVCLLFTLIFRNKK